ncbi:NLR family CARD domain-containing protein 4 [Holothuria leucospilota]|uniref:NLR family CARD domain-containing protein 4 n=1 Tax=Holothuria leucospilota TaxID=206669 RepID=A0A9Q1CMR3_HOLLE|nr:NLR family CARD domain-containing protein 4 [Holothuria leucospilota]
MRQRQRGSMDDEIVKDSMISYLAGQMPNEWKEVGRCLGFNDAELTHMRSDHYRLKDAIHEMLLKWKQRNGSRATCLVLAKGLEDAKRLDLAQELTGFNSSQSSVERELSYKMYERVGRRTADSIPSHQMETDIATTRESPFLGDKANVFVQCLQKKYRRLLSLLKPIPWERQLKKKIEDTFQNVGITWLEGGKDGKYKENWKFLDSYEAIFTYDGLAVADRIVIEGDPGCGKTTLMYQLARLWCNNEPPMISVHIFILLLMKHVKPGMSIYTAIRTTLLPRDTYLTDEDIRVILEAKSSKILALDGLDEYSGRNSEGFEDSDFMASLKGEMLLDIKEIVTTRSSCLSDLGECSVERIRIEGFTEDSWTAYLRNAFSGDEGTARGVFESITRHDILETLCSIPLFFMLICHITKDDIRLGRKPKLTTVTEVFKHIITCMRAHYDNKNIDTIPKVESEGELIEELAFCGLLSTSLQLTWSKEHIATSAEYDVLVTCGILVEEDGDVNVGNSVFDIDMRPKAVRFRHMLFQEWHGATYFSRLLKNSEDKFIEKIKEVNPDDLHYLLRFTCGLNTQATNLILEHLLKMQKLDTFCMCFIEHTQDQTSLKEVVAKMCRNVLRLSWSQGAVVHRGYASLLQFATEQKIAVRHISIEPQALKRFALEKMILTSGVQLKPLVTVKSLAFEGWPDEKAFPWLERCENLDTLAIYTFNEDVDPTLLWDIFGKTNTKVYYSTKDSSYILRYKQWMNKHDFIRCDKCGEEHINGYRFRCKTCKYFNLCETCKETEKHDDRHIFYKFDGSETVHRYIECSCCGEEHIRGSRFRCETCKYFNLCIICKDKGEHKEHKFKEYDGNEPQHIGINCSICEEDSIRGDRHRCKSCEYFNLCDVCKLKGVHAEHEFRRFDGTEPIYDFIKCDGCGEHSIRGYRYRCVTCKFYNLCGSCKNNGKHREHNFRKFDGTEVRHNFKPCDGCGEDEIRGVRYRCKTCENFNLCEWCMSRVLHEKHEFEKFDGTQHTHTYVKCNGCGEKSIVGNRYRCKVCKNFNLCESCKGRKVHTQHEFHQYDGKEHMHSFIRCNGCGERNIRGNRYRCTTCEYFNLCEWCEKREHNHHTLQRFDGKETSHGASCDRCGEKHIKGDRFRCKSCTNVNLCRMCKENGNHGYHEFQKIERNKYTHDFINCNECGEHNINGVRYRCKTCVFYNLCSWCKNKGIHSEHDFRIFNGTEAKYDYVKCNGCGEKSIIGDRYRCNQCDFFNLCECCKENGIHKEHDFYKFDEFEHTHGYIGCDCCGEIEIRGDRFKCTVCDYFNLCRWCKNKGVHAEHEFEKYDGSEHKHVMIKCDGCNEKHIRGDRYRCLTCKYFNLCAWCKQKGRHKEHDFRKFDGSECIQGQVKCDGCLETSIRGDRYRCNLCIYYNLCSQCMDRKEHRAHEFTRLDGTEHKHDFIACTGCGEVDIRGDRYRCKICKYYNLCEWCKERGEHDEHEFQRFNGSEPKHDFIKCTFCGERSIIGNRYRCTSCRNVNQCELCKEKDLHPEHEYKRYDGHEHVHVFINCDGCGEVDIRGDRYRCKTCDYYNLCEQCHSAGVHDEHKFGKFDGKENRHDCIKCDGCGEKHIRSLRYRCKTCKYFNLCEWCKDRGKHKEHHFQTFDGYEFKHNRKSCGRCGERHIRGIRYRCKTLDSYNLCQLCMESSEHKSVKFQRYDGKEVRRGASGNKVSFTMITNIVRVF